MIKKYGVFLIVLFFVQVGLFAEPAWIKNPYSEYSKDAYLCGVGFGVNQTDADISAKAEIAGFFGTSINSESETHSYSVNSQYYDYYTDSMDVKSKQKISEKDIAGMEIVSRYSDSNGFYSLAVLNKHNAFLYYQSEIPAIQSKLISQKDGILSRNGDLSNMYDYADYCDNYALYSKYIKIVNALEQTVSVSVNSKVLDPMLLESSVFDGISFSVFVSGGDISGEIEKAIKTVLTDMGLIVTEGPSRYVLKADVYMEEVVLGSNPNKFIKYNINIALLDKVTGKQYYTFNKGGREGQRSLAAAHSKTIYSIVKIVNEDFSKNFRKNLFN